MQHLDRDAAMDQRVLALVHGAHSALAEQALDLVLALDPIADLQAHGSLCTAPNR
jgi:hypothetical protein